MLKSGGETKKEAYSVRPVWETWFQKPEESAAREAANLMKIPVGKFELKKASGIGLFLQ